MPSSLQSEIDRLRTELDVATALIMSQAAELAELRKLPTQAIETTRRLRDVTNSLTARCNELRGLQHALLGAGLDEWGRTLETIADRIELTFVVLASTRGRLAVAATGSAQDTMTRATTGEWAALPPDPKRTR